MFNCDAYPRLDTYEKAVAHFESVKPMARGDMQGAKPIHLRSHGEKYSIITMVGKEVHWGYQYTTHDKYKPEGYFCKWLPNGEIHIRPPRYNCVQDRLWSMLGLNFFRKDNKLWVNTYDTFPLRPRTDDPKYANIFKRDTSGHLQLTNPMQREKMVLNRAGANNVRARYSDFIQYVKGMTKLRDDHVFTLQEAFDVFGARNNDDMMPHDWWSLNSPPSIHLKNILDHARRARTEKKQEVEDRLDEFFDLATSGDTEKYYRALLWMVTSFGEHVYNPIHKVRLLSPKKAMQALDMLMFYRHRGEAFRVKRLAQGDTSRDVYGWMFD